MLEKTRVRISSPKAICLLYALTCPMVRPLERSTKRMHMVVLPKSTQMP